MAGQAENKLDVGSEGRKGVEVHVSQVLVILTLTVPAALLCRIASHGLWSSSSAETVISYPRVENIHNWTGLQDRKDSPPEALDVCSRT